MITIHITIIYSTIMIITIAITTITITTLMTTMMKMTMTMTMMRRKRNNDERRTALSRVPCKAKARCLEDTCRHICKLNQARLKVSDQATTQKN